MIRILSTFFLLLILGCQTPPTKIVQLDQSQTTRSFENVKFGEKWDVKKSVVIDTRSRFEYEMSKTPRSFHVYWKDWLLKDYKGIELERRKVELQRRLAINGVDPYTRVVIFGQGLKGQGEEMLVAAILFRLGVKKINVVQPGKFQKSLVSKDTEAVSNLPYWEQPLQASWTCADKKPIKKVTAKDFTNELQLKNFKNYKGSSLNLKSDKSLWAYGAAFQLRKSGTNACVVE